MQPDDADRNCIERWQSIHSTDNTTDHWYIIRDTNLVPQEISGRVAVANIEPPVGVVDVLVPEFRLRGRRRELSDRRHVPTGHTRPAIDYAHGVGADETRGRNSVLGWGFRRR